MRLPTKRVGSALSWIRPSGRAAAPAAVQVKVAPGSTSSVSWKTTSTSPGPRGAAGSRVTLAVGASLSVETAMTLDRALWLPTPSTPTTAYQ